MGTLLILAIAGLSGTAQSASAASAAPDVCANGCAYKTIQGAIDDASAGDTINVAAGTYHRDGIITIDKSLSLVGPKANINPVTQAGSRGFGEAILTTTYSSIIGIAPEIDGVTVEGFTFEGAGVIGYRSTHNVTFANNIIQNRTSGAEPAVMIASGTLLGESSNWSILDNVINPGDTGNNSGIHVAETVGLTISGNEIKNTGYAAMNIGQSSGFNISGNTIANTPVHGINVSHQTGTNTISGNTLTNTAAGTSGTAAIRLYGDESAGATTIANNTITGSKIGVWLRDTTPDALDLTVSNNALSANTVGVQNDRDAAIDATSNWWGSADPDFTSLVSGNVTYQPWFTDAAMTIRSDKKTVPDSSGNATVTPEAPTVVVSSPSQAVTVTVSDGTKDAGIDYSAHVTGGTGAIPQTTITASGGVTVNIPKTGITATLPTWDGVITAPTAVPHSSVTIPTESGTAVTVATAIQVGSRATGLTFDKGVRLLLPGHPDKLVGFERDGTFTPIATECSADNQATGDELAVGGDCYISVGADMVIWTKHFTTFVAYSSGAATPMLPATGAEAPGPALWAGSALLLVLGSALFVARRRTHAKS